MNKYLLLSVLSLTSGVASAQYGIGTNSTHPSAVFELNSQTKGFLPPRMDEAQRLAIPTPPDGLVVYQTNNTTTSTAGLYVRSSGTWAKATESAGNGLTYNPVTGRVDLGGTLTAPATITNGTTGNDFRLANLAAPSSSNVLTRNNTTGAVESGDVVGVVNSSTGIVDDARVNDALTINGGTINSTPIGQGASGTAAGSFTTLSASGATTLSNAAITVANIPATGATMLIGRDASNNLVTAPLPAAAWNLTGNSGTSPTTNFVGTTDNQPLVFGTNTSASPKRDGYIGTAAGSLTAFGHDAGNINTNTGTDNTAIGAAALTSNTTGNRNTAIGAGAASQSTSAIGLTAVGSNALGGANTGNYNTAIGSEVLATNTTGLENTAVGYQAMRYNTTGTASVALGANALNANTTGNANTAVGQSALLQNTTGFANNAFGVGALASNIDGEGNTAIGSGTLQNSNGSNNTASGTQAMLSNTTGNSNNASGRRALFSNTTGSENIAVGLDAAYNNISGNSNIAIGNSSFSTNTAGSRNTILGSYADVGSANLANASAIGSLARVDASNSLVLGSISGVNGASSNVNVGIGTTTPGNALHVVPSSGLNPVRIDGLVADNTATSLVTEVGGVLKTTTSGSLSIAASQITGSLTDAQVDNDLTITSTKSGSFASPAASNTPGLTVTGDGTGAGIVVNNGATVNGLAANTAATPSLVVTPATTGGALATIALSSLAGNALIENGNAIDLGGPLTADVVIDGTASTTSPKITISGKVSTVDDGVLEVTNTTDDLGGNTSAFGLTSTMEYLPASPANTGSIAGYIAGNSSDARSNDGNFQAIGSDNIGIAEATTITGDYPHAIGVSGIGLGNHDLPASGSGSQAVVIGLSGGTAFDGGTSPSGNSSWNGIGTEGYVDYDRGTDGVAAGGYFNGNNLDFNSLNSATPTQVQVGTSFGVVGAIGDNPSPSYQTMFDAAFTNRHISVVAVNRNASTATHTQLALYTRGEVQMAALPTTGGANVMMTDAAGIVSTATGLADAQVADALTIAGGTVTASPINASTIGSVTPASGTFTELKANTAFVLPTGTVDPTTPVPGQVYLNTTTGKFRGWTGSAWVDLN